jgi:hypothetical protein
VSYTKLHTEKESHSNNIPNNDDDSLKDNRAEDDNAISNGGLFNSATKTEKFDHTVAVPLAVSSEVVSSLIALIREQQQQQTHMFETFMAESRKDKDILRTIAERQQTQIELLVRVLHGAGKANEKT